MAIAPGSQLQPALSAKAPFDAAVVTLDAGDVLADAFVEEGSLEDEPEAKSVLDHGEASADEAGYAGEAAADILAGICWYVGYPALSRHPMADALDLLSLQGRPNAGGDENVAILCGRMAHFHQPLSGAAKSLGGLSAKPALDDCHTIADHQLPVEP